MKVNIKKLPAGYSVVNGKIVNTMSQGGASTGDQRNYGLVTTPPSQTDSFLGSGNDSAVLANNVGKSIQPVPRDEANLEAEKGETVLTDFNNDGNFELYTIGGNRHHKGGTPLNLPPQSFIFSDTSKMKLNKYELAEMGITSKKKITPANVSKGYELNKFIGILDDAHSDNITIDTSEYMLNKNKKSLSQLAFLQEAKKQFEDGVPLASYAYLTEKGINPIQFSQQVEQISKEEAEQKMLMQLPYEQRMELMIAKERAQQQAAMQQQQQMMAQQQQMQGQQGGPMHQMPDGSMMPGAAHGQAPQGMPPQGMPPQGMPPQGMPPQGMPPQGMPPQGMPPQGMMPPQAMPQPAMARQGGQLSMLQSGGQPRSVYCTSCSKTYYPCKSNLTDAQCCANACSDKPTLQVGGSPQGLGLGSPLPPFVSSAVRDNTGVQSIDMSAINNFLGNSVNTNNTNTPSSLNNPVIAGPQSTYLQNMSVLNSQHANNANALQQSYGAAYTNNAQTRDQEIKDWEQHILEGGAPPATATPAYTIAYGNVYPGQQLPTATSNDENSEFPDHVTNVYKNTYLSNEGPESNSNSPFENYRYNNDNVNYYDRDRREFTKPGSENTLRSGIPLDFKNTSSPYYVGSQWTAQDGIETGDGKIDSTNLQINTGNQTRPDILLSQRNITSKQLPYHSGTGFTNTTLQNYNGINLGFNPGAQLKVPWGFASSPGNEGMPVVGRGNNLANLDVSRGTNLTPNDYGRTNLYAEGRLGLGYGIGNNWQSTWPDSPNSTSMTSNQVHYLNPYLSSEAGINFGLKNNRSIGAHGSLDSEYSPYGRGIGAGVNFQKDKFGFKGGVRDLFRQYGPQAAEVGASYTFEHGGSPKTEPGDDRKISNFGQGDGLWNKNYTPYTDYTSPINVEDGNYNLNYTPDIGNSNNINPYLRASSNAGGISTSGGINWNRPYSINSNTSLTPRLGINHALSESGDFKTTGNAGLSLKYSFKKGGEYEYEGETYSRRRLKKMATSGDPAKERLAYMIMNDGKLPPADVNTQKLIDEINTTRLDVEESSVDRLSGSAEWSENYLADTDEAQKYRDNRYTAYSEFQTQAGSTPMNEEEYHQLYNRFQNQNRWMNETYSSDELSGPEWDSSYSYNTDGTKNTSDNRGKNWKYKSMIADNQDFTALSPEEIKHMQAGFIGGKSMSIAGDERAEFQNTGVADQTMFNGQAISGADGVWGNTTNRELETSGNVTPGQECSNAEEMQAACSEVGGVWSPFVAAVPAVDGNAATPSSGCSCSKQINVDKDKITDNGDDGFWLQDEMAIAGAMDAKMSLNKKYPWAPQYDMMQIDPVFKDPTREIAAIGEQANIAANTASTFAGPQRAAAVHAKTQGVAGKQIADAMNKVQSDNVTIANTVGQKNKELEYKTQLLNNAESKSLYDNTVLTDQNYEDSLRMANAQILKQVSNAYTNRANTMNLNTLYPNFNINMPSGGIAQVVNQEEFYSDPNYVDPQTSVDRYAAEIDALKRAGIPKEQWPDYISPTQKKPGKTSGQRNQGVITGGYPNNGQPSTVRYGKETRRKNLLKKGAELRNWFSPLRGN